MKVDGGVFVMCWWKPSLVSGQDDSNISTLFYDASFKETIKNGDKPNIYKMKTKMAVEGEEKN